MENLCPSVQCSIPITRRKEYRKFYASFVSLRLGYRSYFFSCLSSPHRPASLLISVVELATKTKCIFFPAVLRGVRRVFEKFLFLNPICIIHNTYAYMLIVYTYVHIFIYVCIHTHTHTHLHTYI